MLRAVPSAELVYANVLDGRVYDAEGLGGQPLVYTYSIPGRALPFAVGRQWKAPQGLVIERFELIAPSGEVAHRSTARPRRMPGQMDLTEIVDRVDDCTLPELGEYLASFLIDDEVQGQVEFQVVLQQPPEKLEKAFEDGFRRVDAIWVGVEEDGRDRAVPVWFAYQKGRAYVLHATDEGSGEQRVPGVDLDAGITDLLVVTRHKGRDTRSNRIRATCRVIEPDQPEFDQLARLLADRRRDRHGPPDEAIAKWKQGCVILELTPHAPA
jgi:hypothetical protein